MTWLCCRRHVSVGIPWRDTGPRRESWSEWLLHAVASYDLALADYEAAHGEKPPVEIGQG